MEVAMMKQSEGSLHSTQPAELTDEQLDAVAGGNTSTSSTTSSQSSGTPFLQFTFKLVAVKTVSWAHD
jgi:hypothetical protein